MPPKGKSSRHGSSGSGYPSQRLSQSTNNSHAPGHHSLLGSPPCQYAPWQHGELHRLSGAQGVPEPHDTQMTDAPATHMPQAFGGHLGFPTQTSYPPQVNGTNHSHVPYAPFNTDMYPGHPLAYHSGTQISAHQNSVPYPSQPTPWLSNLRSTQNHAFPVQNMPSNQTFPSHPAIQPNHNMPSFGSFAPYVQGQGDTGQSRLAHHKGTHKVTFGPKEPKAATTAKLSTFAEATSTNKDEITQDEDYARRLQAEFDAEDTEEESSYCYDDDTDSTRDPTHTIESQRQSEVMKSVNHTAQGAIEISGNQGSRPAPYVDEHSDHSSGPKQQFCNTAPISTLDVAIEREVDDTEEQRALQQFGHTIMDTNCSNCKIKLLPSRKAVLEHGKSLIGGPPDVAGTISCRGCHVKLCIGCGWIAGNKATAKRTNRMVMCCTHGRLFVLWTWLCMIESDETREPSTRRLQPGPNMNLLQTGRRAMHREPTRLANGTGYGGVTSDGGSYVIDTGPWGTPSQHAAGISPQSHKLFARRASKKANTSHKAFNQEDPLSTLFTRFFKDLADLLPNLWRDQKTDVNLLEMTILMLKRSRALEAMAELLRNDSFDDVAKDYKLYMALLQVLQNMVQNPALISLVTGERMVYSGNAGLLAASLPKSESDQKGKIESVQPLATIISRLKSSAQRMQERVSVAADEFENTEGWHMLAICAQICILYDSLQANNAINGILASGKGKEKATESPKTIPEDLREWHRETCVDAVEDELIQAHFRYARESQTGIQPAKGRMKRLVTELSTLQSSLPEGIFVRHGMSRLDIMKVLIVGPKDTPYENGLFEFDLFCPVNYPQCPPMMLFRTTGRGLAHFNPNLYNDGKVCLSLLGTWSGPSWDPNESTLLQILVSIQSMIFCDEPWYNEPGRESRSSERASKEYNVVIQSLTVPYALTDWLKAACDDCPEKKNPIWHQIVEKHFQTHGSRILETLKGWEKKAADFPARIRPGYFGDTEHSPFPPHMLVPPYAPALPHHAISGWAMQAKHLAAANKMPLSSKKFKTSPVSWKNDDPPPPPPLEVHYYGYATSDSDTSEMSSTLSDYKSSASKAPPDSLPEKSKSWAEVVAAPKGGQSKLNSAVPGSSTPLTHKAGIITSPAPLLPPITTTKPPKPNAPVMVGTPPPPPVSFQLHSMFVNGLPPPPLPKFSPAMGPQVSVEHFSKAGHHQPLPSSGPTYHEFDWQILNHESHGPSYSQAASKKKPYSADIEPQGFGLYHPDNNLLNKTESSLPPASKSSNTTSLAPPPHLPGTSDKPDHGSLPTGPSPGPPPPSHYYSMIDPMGIMGTPTSPYSAYSLKSASKLKLIKQLLNESLIQEQEDANGKLINDQKVKMGQSSGGAIPPTKLDKKPKPQSESLSSTLLAKMNALRAMGATQKDFSFLKLEALDTPARPEGPTEDTKPFLNQLLHYVKELPKTSPPLPPPPPMPPGPPPFLTGFAAKDDVLGIPGGFEMLAKASPLGLMNSLKKNVEEYEKVWKRFLGEEAE